LNTSGSWSYRSWIYNYLCNQYISPLKLWLRILLMAGWTQYNIMWCSSVVFSAHSGFLHQLNCPPRYSWNYVESCAKRHNPTSTSGFKIQYLFLIMIYVSFYLPGCFLKYLHPGDAAVWESSSSITGISLHSKLSLL